jgi:hypothetical protein
MNLSLVCNIFIVFSFKPLLRAWSFACHCELSEAISFLIAQDKLRNRAVHNDLKNRDCRVAKNAPRNDTKGFFSKPLEDFGEGETNDAVIPG